jgi:hypothetical protein
LTHCLIRWGGKNRSTSRPLSRESYKALGFDHERKIEKAILWSKHINKKNQFEKRKIASAALRVKEEELRDSGVTPD